MFNRFINKLIFYTLIIILMISFHTTYYAQEECRNSVGINLTDLKSVLVDVFKTSRKFWEADPDHEIWDTEIPLNLDENGYPTTLREGFRARTLLLEALDGKYPTGQYTLFYDGEGEIELGMNAENPVFTDNNGIDNQIIFEVNQPTLDGIMVDIKETNPDNYIRNIRIIRPDDPGTDYVNTYQTDYFRPIFFDRLKNFKVIRFMDWQGTNFSPIKTWEDRTTLSSRGWAENFGDGPGMPLEVLISLCNKTGISPWFCMPHQADDDFIQKFAEMVRDSLNPQLDIYIEYSNEVWNFIFVDDAWWEGQSGQNSYAYQQAQLRGWDCDTCYFWDPFGKWVAQRSIEIFDIWNSVFSNDSDRIKKILPIQNGPGNATPATLQHQINGIPACQQADFVAGAPYFDGNVGPETEGLTNWTVEEILDSIDVHMFDFDTGPYWAEQTIQMLNQAPYADYDLQYIAYEGGQHLFNFYGQPYDEISTLFIEANRHPRMGELYKKYLDWWKNSGAGIMTLYTHTATPSRGHFGLLEYLDQDTLTAPKWLAVQEWINQECTSIIDFEQEKGIPDDFCIWINNFPNPFNSKTFIQYQLPQRQHTQLKIYDLQGRLISIPVNKVQEKGIYRIEWDAGNQSSGCYFYSITINNKKYNGKMILIK